MADPRVLAYIKNNIKLGYSEEQLRNALVSAGYNVRDIDEAIDQVLHPQDLKSQKPAEMPKEEKGFFATLPLWMILSGAAGILLLIVILVLLIPSGSGSPGLLFQEGIKVVEYDLKCDGTASMFTLKVKNEGSSELSNMQLFIDDAFQSDQVVSKLGTGSSATYSYAGVDCTEWVGEKIIKIVSDKATAEGTIAFECITGTC